MSWEDIVKKEPYPLQFIFIIDGLEKMIYKKYKGDDATKDVLSPYGKKMDKRTRMFIGVSKRLDKIAELEAQLAELKSEQKEEQTEQEEE